jgi:hypothetical protein
MGAMELNHEPNGWLGVYLNVQNFAGEDYGDTFYDEWADSGTHFFIYECVSEYGGFEIGD